ncbi:DNA polymerase domain-containing protein, partial [Nanoarchaeota archaeon]
PGFYQDVVVFDYRSLYPSIIASHNISIGTLNCSCCDTQKVETKSGKHWFCEKRRGFLSKVIEDLITRRARIKEMLKQKDDLLLYARSITLKYLANSFYGYLGFEIARWYCHECAASTTAFGRHYVQDVMKKAEEEGYEVIYGDTDSAMLLLGDKSRKDALLFAEKVNQNLPRLMELELEGFYPRAIFVPIKGTDIGAKKKYAMIDDIGKIKIRGFETVRRNWSPIAKEVQRDVLDILLREGNVEKAVKYVKIIVEQLRKHEVPVKKVTIHTQLQKKISEYSSIGPHVAAAKIMEEEGYPVGPGSLIKYVVVKGSGRIRDKVKLPEDVSKDDYDSDYYIDNQVVPSVSSIFLALGYETNDLLIKGAQSKLGDY